MGLRKDKAENPTDFELVDASTLHDPGYQFGIYANAAGDIYVTGENGVEAKFVTAGAGALSGVLATSVAATTTVEWIALYGK